jgi:tetratricopeptide (TPR) repeat protein
MKIFRIFVLLSLGLFATGLVGVAQVHADAFEEANRAFAAGQFAESARGYETVLKHDGYSAAVLFDLGNADLRLGQTGDAILNFERAKWLAPHDPDIAANLRFAQKRAGLVATPDSWSENVAGCFSPNGWAWLATVALVVLCAGILGVQLAGKYRNGLYLLNTVSAVVLVVAIGAVAVRYQQLDQAILPAKVTPGLISPFTGAKPVAEFSAGQTVTVERAHGGFCFVRDPAGHSGWVSNGQVVMVVPKSS